MIVNNIFQNIQQLKEKKSFFFEGATYTYEELGIYVTSIYGSLQKYAQSGDRIGIITGDNIFTYASLLACWALRCAYVPLNLKNPSNRLQDQIEQAELSCILGFKNLPFECNIPFLNTSQIPLKPDRFMPLQVQDDDLAYLLFTSGSTGRPKGVPIYHRNLDSFLQTILFSGIYDFHPDDRFLQMFELTFDLSVFSWCVPLCVGASIYVVPESGVSYLKISSLLEDHDLTVALMVPSVLSYLRRYFDEITLPSLRWGLFCGEALPADLVTEWATCVPNACLENVYGPTEATIFCTRYRISLPIPAQYQHNGIVSIGQPFPNMQCIIVDEKGITELPGKSGELCLVGNQVTDMYWRNPQKSITAFVDIPAFGQGYKTGDICIETDDNHYNYIGRADFQLKIDGYRVEAGEIEHHARNFLQKTTIALGISENNQTILVLAVETVPNDIDIPQLLEHLKFKIPDYMIPKKIIPIKQFPINLNGKIDRKAIHEIVSTQILNN
ncbi:MAG: AMP-binding protein [Bacteroidia bacterium]|nr:AMP-binding protein [Bacteroidia bacterium]